MMRRVYNVSFVIAIFSWIVIYNINSIHWFSSNQTVELPLWFLYTVATITTILGMIGKTIQVLECLNKRKKDKKDKEDKE